MELITCAKIIYSFFALTYTVIAVKPKITNTAPFLENVTNSNLSEAKSNLELIVEPFSHCSTTLITPNQNLIANLRLQLNPIIVINEEGNTTFPENGTTKSVFVRRRNPNKHCWAFILINVEQGRIDDGGSKSRLLTYIANEAPFPEMLAVPQYYIILTQLLDTFQKNFSDWSEREAGEIGLREFILIPIKLHNGVASLEGVYKTSQHITLYYHNRYYKGLTKSFSEPWIPVHCSGIKGSANFFSQLELVAETVSELNKYFWSMQNWEILNYNTEADTFNNLFQKLGKKIKNFSLASNSFICQ